MKEFNQKFTQKKDDKQYLVNLLNFSKEYLEFYPQKFRDKAFFEQISTSSFTLTQVDISDFLEEKFHEFSKDNFNILESESFILDECYKLHTIVTQCKEARLPFEERFDKLNQRAIHVQDIGKFKQSISAITEGLFQNTVQFQELNEDYDEINFSVMMNKDIQISTYKYSQMLKENYNKVQIRELKKQLIVKSYFFEIQMIESDFNKQVWFDLEQNGDSINGKLGWQYEKTNDETTNQQNQLFQDHKTNKMEIKTDTSFNKLFNNQGNIIPVKFFNLYICY